jgi:cysteinyl-tRNA synthetase
VDDIEPDVVCGRDVLGRALTDFRRHEQPIEWCHRRDENADWYFVSANGMDAYKGAIDMLLNMRLEAKRNKDWGTSDKIRNALTELGFTIKDTKDGFEWSL